MPDTAPHNPQPAASGGHERSGHAPAYRSRGAAVLFVALFAALLACDLGFKAWSFAYVPNDHIGQPLIPNVLALRLTVNRGAVFGMMQGQKVFFVFASLAALGMIGYFFAQSRAGDRPIHAALAAILAGAMGNLYDRIFHDGVRDMLLLFPDLKLPWGLRWPGGPAEVYPWIFNLADVFLLAGIAVVVVRSLFVKGEGDSTQRHRGTEQKKEIEKCKVKSEKCKLLKEPFGHFALCTFHFALSCFLLCVSVVNINTPIGVPAL